MSSAARQQYTLSHSGQCSRVPPVGVHGAVSGRIFPRLFHVPLDRVQRQDTSTSPTASAASAPTGSHPQRRRVGGSQQLGCIIIVNSGLESLRRTTNDWPSGRPIKAHTRNIDPRELHPGQKQLPKDTTGVHSISIPDLLPTHRGLNRFVY